MGRIAASRTTAITDLATSLRAAGRDIISLSVGEPDFDTPAHVIDAAHDAMRAGQTRYTPVAGTAVLRQAVADMFTHDMGIAATPERVIITAGGKPAIFHALAATLNPGDEVVIPAPYWVSYPEIVRYCGGEARIMPTSQSASYRLSAAQLADAITPHSRWLILNSPGNPTGTIYSADDLAALAAVLRAHPQMMVLSDDIYRPIRYGAAPHASMAQIAPDLADRVLTVNGLAKSHAMTGWRIGYATGPQWLIAAMAKLQSHSAGNPSSISQAGALAALQGPQDFLTGWVAHFARRRTMVCDALSAMPGVVIYPPEGAFYAYAETPDLIGKAAPDGSIIGDDEALCRYLIEEAGVALVPASSFGGDHGFRLSFAASDCVLDEALKRIGAAIARLA